MRTSYRPAAASTRIRGIRPFCTMSFDCPNRLALGPERARSPSQSRMETDFLIIGAGVAGLSAAIEAAVAGRVLVLTKDRLTESATEYSQGGVAVALSDEDETQRAL